MRTLKQLSEIVLRFREVRDWKQFHQPKDVAISLMLEAAEVAEVFQWKTKEEVEAFDAKKRTQLGEELSDVMYWLLVIAEDFGIDLDEAFDAKMAKNEANYPVEKCKGRATKYTELK